MMFLENTRLLNFFHPNKQEQIFVLNFVFLVQLFIC